MVRILAVGDFHGKFPERLKKVAKDVDLILSVGDYPPWSLKKPFFKYCYRTEKELWEVVGKKKFKKSFLKDFKEGEKVISYLNRLEVPIITTIGNYDASNINDTFNERKTKGWSWADKDFFSPMISKYKRIKRADYRSVRIGEVFIIGGFGHSNRGHVKSVAYRKHRKKLDKLFRKYSEENRERKVIFIFHNMPYDCALDKVRDKKANKLVRGKHFGSKLTRRIIDKYQPVLGIGGHLHENQGKCKIGKTLVINTGPAGEGKAAIIDYDEKRGKIKKVKFLR